MFDLLQWLLDVCLPLALSVVFLGAFWVGWDRRSRPHWVLACAIVASVSGMLVYHSWVGDFFDWLLRGLGGLIADNLVPLGVLLVSALLLWGGSRRPNRQNP